MEFVPCLAVGLLPLHDDGYLWYTAPALLLVSAALACLSGNSRAASCGRYSYLGNALLYVAVSQLRVLLLAVPVECTETWLLIFTYNGPCIRMHICTYTYIYRERERELCCSIPHHHLVENIKEIKAPTCMPSAHALAFLPGNEYTLNPKLYALIQIDESFLLGLIA